MLSLCISRKQMFASPDFPQLYPYRYQHFYCSLAPHSSQNLAVSLTVFPQPGQSFGWDFPHFEQNFARKDITSPHSHTLVCAGCGCSSAASRISVSDAGGGVWIPFMAPDTIPATVPPRAPPTPAIIPSPIPLPVNWRVFSFCATVGATSKLL